MQEILLLHGAAGDSEQLKALDRSLSVDHTVYRMNFNGHGGTPFTGHNFSIESFATEVLDLLSANNISSINIFGYSMGGYVGMYLAKHHPQKINKLITLATKFHWDETIAAKESAMLNAQKIEEKVPAFAAALKKRHYPADWKTVLLQTAAMLVDMGRNDPLPATDYKSIEQPALLMLGDRDKMVSLEETLTVYRQLPNAQLSILPGTGHPIESADTERLAFEIRSFLQ